MVELQSQTTSDWGVLITARLKSTRLPKKVLRDLHGHPMIWHLIERMKRVSGSSNVVVITSTVGQDDELEEYCHSIDVDVFRGHPDDVLTRMLDAADSMGWTDFISCTADNPFVDPEYARELMIHHKTENADLSLVRGLPFGVFSYAVRTEGLRLAVSEKQATDTEVWGPYFTENPRLSCSFMPVTCLRHRRPELRLTVDENADFAFAEALLERTRSELPTLDELLDVVDQEPNLAALNAGVQQKPVALPKFRKQ